LFKEQFRIRKTKSLQPAGTKIAKIRMKLLCNNWAPNRFLLCWSSAHNMASIWYVVWNRF